MSENNQNSNELNNVIEEFVENAGVITVPIDDTLSNSGEAADAKAVGDALAGKANKSELSTAVSVNGQTADNQGLIILLAEHIPVSDAEGAESVKDVLEGLQEQDAGDIYMDGSAQEKVTVKAAVEELQAELTDEEIRQILADAGYEEDDEE